MRNEACLDCLISGTTSQGVSRSQGVLSLQWTVGHGWLAPGCSQVALFYI